jgi:hypothetical protein
MVAKLVFALLSAISVASAVTWPDRFSVHVTTTIHKGRETITGLHDWNRDYKGQMFLDEQRMSPNSPPTIADYVCVQNNTHYEVQRVFIPKKGPTILCNVTSEGKAPTQIAVPTNSKLTRKDVSINGVLCNVYTGTGTEINSTYFVTQDTAILVRYSKFSATKTVTKDFTLFNITPAVIKVPHVCFK